MYLLHTNEFEQQVNDLNESDLAAAWSLLLSFKTPHMVIYNCGADAGASQGHKHLQLFPAPAANDCVLFPENLDLNDGIFLSIETSESIAADIVLESIHSEQSIPFQNFVTRLGKNATISELCEKYKSLLSVTKQALEQAGHDGRAYNVVLLPTWIALIPRTHANYKGKAPTNAAGMVGMICVDGDDEVDEWLEFGIAKHLTYLGLAHGSK